MNRLADRQKELLAAADISSQRRLQAAQELLSHRKLAEEVFIFNKIFLVFIMSCDVLQLKTLNINNLKFNVNVTQYDSAEESSFAV